MNSTNVNFLPAHIPLHSHLPLLTLKHLKIISHKPNFATPPNLDQMVSTGPTPAAEMHAQNTALHAAGSRDDLLYLVVSAEHQLPTCTPGLLTSLLA